MLVTLSNRLAIIVARGNDPAGGKPEDPGALKVYDFKDGLLTNRVTVALAGGYGFGARHLDFHPSRPWMYVLVERQNKLAMFRFEGEKLSPDPAYVKDLLADPRNVRPRQLGGTVHVHPNGRLHHGASEPFCVSYC